MCKGNLSRVSLARSVTRPQATGFALQNRTNTKKDTLWGGSINQYIVFREGRHDLLMPLSRS